MTATGPIRFVFFDLDGVLFDPGYREQGAKVGVSTWRALFDGLGITAEHTRLKQAFTNGHFPGYMEWTDEACRVLQQYGLTEQVFMAVLEGIKPMPGARATFAELKRRGYSTGIITGSFKYLADRAGDLLGIDHLVAHCDLSFDPEGRLDGWYLTPCDYEGKSDYFHRLARDAGLTPEQCAYVGDEVNDVTLFAEAGLSIAFNAHKQAVREGAGVVIDQPDLRDILPHLA